ncbi:GNAT family N-acetyltransferase [Pyxidicoccus fallax]|uniref:GNAT family N-acetyltransferase n=1 Tax=Pyxidicoccus fallax TaxID=394095 RepID=A0A848M0I2_9BACT|nr:GNAT family N-acetyltransferase [Pyxidicoccus fallax]NMO22894.1 GNAT family N-acetyltransferase [Pyxidicoccus fallax]NPC85172.1 GNAT family N-acetyltransferase [Pyxidicoccus fallax]
MPSSRFYAGEQDLRAMTRLVSEAHAAHGPQVECTVGDIDWRMYRNAFVRPEQNVRLWHDERGHLVGFAWGYVNGDVDLLIHPREHAATLMPQILEWAQAWFPTRGASGERPLHVWALESNTSMTRALEQQGWRRIEDCYLHLARPTADTGTAPLPPGYTVRNVRGPEETAARAEVHRRAFGTERVTTEVYQRVMGASHYRAHLDLVAEAPDGSLAALALCWLDPENGLGEFEPVATAPEHRRKGLAQALIQEGVRRMWKEGARTALVYAHAANPASVALYESAGFRVIDRNWGYVAP